MSKKGMKDCFCFSSGCCNKPTGKHRVPGRTARRHATADVKILSEQAAASASSAGHNSKMPTTVTAPPCLRALAAIVDQFHYCGLCSLRPVGFAVSAERRREEEEEQEDHSEGEHAAAASLASLLPPPLSDGIDLAHIALGVAGHDAMELELGDGFDQENLPPLVGEGAHSSSSAGSDESSGTDDDEPLEELKKKNMGRPPLANLPLDQPPQGNCVLTLGQLISRVVVAMSRGNVAARTQQSIWDAFAAGFTALPNFRHAKILLSRQSSLQSKEHAACPNDCYVHRPALADITEEDRRSLQCPSCQQQLTTNRSRAKKVISIAPPQSHTPPHLCSDSHFCSVSVCRCGFCAVAVPLRRHRTTTSPAAARRTCERVLASARCAPRDPC